jgi:hypothetical protein
VYNALGKDGTLEKKMVDQNKIVHMLQAGDPEHRVAALQGLYRTVGWDTDMVHPFIQGCLGDGDAAVRFWARKVVGRFEPARPALPAGDDSLPASADLWPARLAACPSSAVALDLVRQLLASDHPDRRTILLDHLRDTDDPVQISFLTKHLGQTFSDDEMLACLVPFLKHEDDRIVANTIEGIEPIPSPAAVAVLAQMLEHRSQRVRANAAQALARHDADLARTTIVKMLRMTAQPHFVIAACRAAARLRAVEFLPHLAAAMADPLVTADAAQAISAISGDVAVELLERLPELASSEFLRQKVLCALDEHLVKRLPPHFNPWAVAPDESSGRIFEVQEQKIFALAPAMTFADAQAVACAHKLNAFGLISKFLFRPSDEQIRLVYAETRYEPFWHVLCRLHLDYTRTRELELPFDRHVQAVRIGRQQVVPEQGRARLTIDEHCVEDCLREVFVEAQKGGKVALARHIEFPKREIQQTEELMIDDVIVVPARVKASPVVRDLLGDLMKPVKASEINRERVILQRLNLYFRPIFAFEFQWEDRPSFAVLEIDGLTGDLIAGKALKTKFEELFAESSLFELGSEVADLVVPGGALATKLAKAVFGGK